MRLASTNEVASLGCCVSYLILIPRLKKECFGLMLPVVNYKQYSDLQNHIQKYTFSIINLYFLLLKLRVENLREYGSLFLVDLFQLIAVTFRKRDVTVHK